MEVIYKEVLDEFSFNSMNKVLFSRQKDRELIQKTNEEMLTRFITKTYDWKHEKEWRIVLSNLRNDNRIFADIVSAIIIDERALKADNAKKLIDLANERCWTIKTRKKNYTGTKHIYEELKVE